MVSFVVHIIFSFNINGALKYERLLVDFICVRKNHVECHALVR